jgi:UDP-N-acetylmuramate: L-alanyl-gamma-D-glutamyl-meso-diaminopimelate ligase
MMSVPSILESLKHDGIRGEQIDDVDAIAEKIAAEGDEGDVVLVMSSGAFDGVHERILERLRAR